MSPLRGKPQPGFRSWNTEILRSQSVSHSLRMTDAEVRTEKPMTVAVLGGGIGAAAVAGALKLKGTTVHLLEAPELAEQTIRPIQERGGLEVISDHAPGIDSGFAALDEITTDPEAALKDAEIVLYVVPAFAERQQALSNPAPDSPLSHILASRPSAFHSRPGRWQEETRGLKAGWSSSIACLSVVLSASIPS